MLVRDPFIVFLKHNAAAAASIFIVFRFVSFFSKQQRREEILHLIKFCQTITIKIISRQKGEKHKSSERLRIERNKKFEIVEKAAASIRNK